MTSASLPSIASSLAIVLTMAAGLAAGYVLFQKYQGEYYFAKAQRVSINEKPALNEAIQIITQAVNSRASDVRYLNSLGQLVLASINLELNNREDKPEIVQQRLQNLTTALVQVSNQMTTRYKNDSASWAGAGFLYQNLASVMGGADKAAIQAFTEAGKRAPSNPTFYLNLGNIYFSRAERNSLALADAKNRRLTVQNEAEVINLIQADYKNAEENFRKAADLKPDYAQALYNLGVVYERENRVKDAIRQLELTAAVNFNDPGLAFELGLLYYRDGKKDKALNEIVRAVNLFKDYANARWYLALMLEEIGRIDLAKQQLQEILKIEVNKNNPVVLEKLAALEAGEREIPPAKVTSKKPIENAAPKER